MIVFPPSKINLGLQILNKREDGYHNLETLFYPISLCDALEVVEENLYTQEKATLLVEGLPVQGNLQDNLILKAYHLIDAYFPIPELTFCLLKTIPMGAGLGGGSSDAAYAIRLLNQYFNLKIPLEKQMAFAAALGSDCSFFIQDKPCMGFGRGEILEPYPLSLEGYWIALVKPDIHISTARAFSNLHHTSTLSKNKLSYWFEQPIENWKNGLTNDFEASLFPDYPLLAEIKQSLYHQGAVYASMSGSGSTLFGLFRSEPKLHKNYSAHFYWEGKLN